MSVCLFVLLVLLCAPFFCPCGFSFVFLPANQRPSGPVYLLKSNILHCTCLRVSRLHFGSREPCPTTTFSCLYGFYLHWLIQFLLFTVSSGRQTELLWPVWMNVWCPDAAFNLKAHSLVSRPLLWLTAAAWCRYDVHHVDSIHKMNGKSWFGRQLIACVFA